MAVKTTYTLDEFLEWLSGRLRGRVDLFLDWTVAAGSYDDIAEATLISYGISEISEVPDSIAGVQKLRALGLAELWTAVCEALTVEIDHTADGASFSRSQLLTQAQAQLDRATATASLYGWDPGSRAILDTVTDTTDPYVVSNMPDSGGWV